MRNRLDVYSIDYKKFEERLAQVFSSSSHRYRANASDLTDLAMLSMPTLECIYADANIDHSVRTTRPLLRGLRTSVLPRGSVINLPAECH